MESSSTINTKSEDCQYDSGAICLALAAQIDRIPLDVHRIKHQYGVPGSELSQTDIIRAARSVGYKAKAARITCEQLTDSLLPVIGIKNDGAYFLVAKTSLAGGSAESSPKLLVHDPAEGPPKVVTSEELSQVWEGYVILLARRASAEISKKFDIRWFIPSLKKYRKLFGDVLVASFFLQIFALITPLFFQVIMDKVLVHQGLVTLNVIVIGFLVVAVFDAILGGIRTYVFSHTTSRVDVELGAKLFNHLLALPLSYFEARQVGHTVARVRELDTIRNFITGSALTVCVDLLFTVVFFVVMWHYSVSLTLIVMGSVPFYILLSLFISPILRARLDDKFRYGATNQAFLTESVSGMGTIKSAAVEPQMQRMWEDQLAEYVKASFRAQNIGNIANQSAGFISKVTTMFVLWVGAYSVMAGSLTVGQLVAFNMLASRVSGPILKIVQLWQEFQQAGISLKRLGDVLNSPREPGLDRAKGVAPPLHGHVAFDCVRFRYRPEGPVVLEDVSLRVGVGEVLGIVGRSGSGKSTLTKLIQRLYVPEAGRVLLDGIDIAMADTSWLRRHIGVVLQENFLFNRSVRENIALASPGLPIERVIAAAKLAGAHEFILEMPDGYDTIVDEQGSNLSGGQRQRIAIARALVMNPKILIFDEATSALDYESERIIQENMSSICKGRTVFVIAHRLSTIRACNRIIVMDKGKIVEEGNHVQLMERRGHYARLHSYQNNTAYVRAVDL
jgi:subfamily B ATP-binding cassette protein HlyB/CyaB